MFSFWPSILKTVTESSRFSSAGMVFFTVETVAFSGAFSFKISSLLSAFRWPLFAGCWGLTATVLAGMVGLFSAGFSGVFATVLSVPEVLNFWVVVVLDFPFGKPFLMMIWPLLCL